MPNKTDVFALKNVTRTFGHGKKFVTAVDNVNFTIANEEIITIVGGSSCGKSVLAKMLLGLIKPSSGELLYHGKPIDNQRIHWREVQSVFQDPFSCFNQFFKIRSQLKSSFGIFKDKPSDKEMEDRVDKSLLAVNIVPSEIEDKYPFELSGGQMQRMLLARIFILQPKVLIADEPTSMVDACVRANILDYLMKLKEDGNTLLVVEQNVGMVLDIADYVYVMANGKIRAKGTVQELEETQAIKKAYMGGE